MTDEQLQALKAELDEVVALRANLKATQQRCNELLAETREQRKTITEQMLMINGLLTLIGQSPDEPDGDVVVTRVDPKDND